MEKEKDIEFLIEQLLMNDFLQHLQNAGYASDDFRLRDPYVRQLEKESLSGIRCAAAKALGRLKKDPRAIEALRRSLGDWDSNVRAAVAEAIAQISE